MKTNNTNSRSKFGMATVAALKIEPRKITKMDIEQLKSHLKQIELLKKNAFIVEPDAFWFRSNI